MRRLHPFWIGTIAAVVAIAAGVGVYAAFGDDDTSEPPAVEAELSFDEDDDESGQDDLIGGDPTGDLAPDNSFVLLDGGTTTLEDLRGTPVVLNFFAKSCVPCVTEMPAIEAVHQELGDQVKVLGISERESVEAAREIIEETGITYEVGRDPSGELFVAFEGLNMPSTFFIDAEGVVVANKIGAMDADELRDLIDEHLL